MIRRSLVASCSTSLALVLCVVRAVPAGAASKLVVAALGGAAPGGGVFAGPSFVGEPSVASGWLAFRGQVAEGKTSEQLVVENLNARQRTTVASVGGAISADIGKVRQFLGRPTVNARGDVAFAALVTLPDDVKVDPTRPPAGGIFLYSQGTITAIVAPGDDTGLGFLDFTTPISFGDDVNAVDIAERTPALNDSGDVAFVASTRDANGKSSGAIFLKPAGQGLVPVLKLDDPYLDGKFEVLGPPALNNAGTLAFRGSVNGLASLDGVFKLEGGALSLLVKDGAVLDTITDPKPFPIDPVSEFGVVVALNDQGDVACTAGPLFDNSEHANLNDIEGSPGVILIPHQGTPLLVGYPGQPLIVGDVTRAVVSDLTLGPDAGSRVAPPSLMPSGEVVFFAQTNGGSGQQILRANPVARTVTRLVAVGGPSAETTPVGGIYQSASSAPAVDASGGIAFSARLQGSTTSEALFYLPPAGPPESISIGDATEGGFFGGPAFFPPQMNDAGDVVFKSYVARGPAALALFRYHQGQLEANPVVRVGDPAPIEADGSPRFTNLVGEPSVNARGDVAFAATVGSKGRGIFVWSAADGTVRAVAMPQVDVELEPPDPQRTGPLFRSIASNPSLSESGAVAFRATLQYQNPIDVFLGDVKEDGVFLVDKAGIHLVAAEGQDSGVGALFLSFRDPVIQDESILFRALLDAENEPQGFFMFDQPAGRRPVAVERGDLGGMTLDSLLGRGVFDAAGDIVFPARIDTAQGSAGTILRRTAGGFHAIVRTDDRGPEGGSIRSIGRPSVASTGHVAFRLAFFPFSGGAPGLFLAAGDAPLQPYLRVGEVVGDGVKGRITTFNQNVALNRLDQVAMLASIGGSKSGSAILLASPAKLSVQRLAFRRGPGTLVDASVKPQDQVQFSALLKPGKLPGVDATKKTKLGRLALTVVVADTKGTLWSANLSDKDVRVRGRTLIAKGGSAAKTLRILRVQATRDGIRVVARSAALDFTKAPGLRQFDGKSAVILEPPFTVRVDVGADGAADTLGCSQKPRRFRCGH